MKKSNLKTGKETDRLMLYNFSREFSSLKDWENLITGYKTQLLKLIYHIIFDGASLRENNLNRQIIAEQIMWEALDLLRATVGSEKRPKNMLAWLCQTAKNIYIKKKNDGKFSLNQKSLQPDSITLSYEMFQKKQKVSSNIEMLRRYLLENYMPIEIEYIYEYFDNWDKETDKVHLPKTRIEYYRRHGLSDTKRYNLITRFKKYFYRDCKDQVIYRN